MTTSVAKSLKVKNFNGQPNKVMVSREHSEDAEKIRAVPEDRDMAFLMKDSRKNTRGTYTREVIFTVGDIEYHGFIENMSAGGVFIKTDESLSVGKAVEMTFPLSDKAKQVTFHAKIIRNTDDGIGVKFLKSSQAI